MAKKKLRDVIEDLALPKDMVVTLLDRHLAREKIWQVAMQRPVDEWEWLYGLGIIDQPEPEPKAKRKKHVSKGADKYKGQTRRDGRGNRSGKPIIRKLSDRDVVEIRWLCNHTDRTSGEIAKHYGVERESVSHIRDDLRHTKVVGEVEPEVQWW